MTDAEERTRFLNDILKSLRDPTKITQAYPLLDEHIKNSKQDRDLKKKYADWFAWILIVQLLVMNAIFISVGLGWLRFES